MRSRMLLALLLLPIAAWGQTYTYSTLASFPPASQNGPTEIEAPLIIDNAGNLYGTSFRGGTNGIDQGGFGTVFKVSSKGAFTVLHNFTGGDGAWPLANVVRDSAGNLYGTTTSGGNYDEGTVFKMSPAGKVTTLYTFEGTKDGNEPFQPVMLDGKGNLYGYVYEFEDGSQVGSGMIYKITSSKQFSIVYNFDTAQGATGINPAGRMILGRDGNFYGATQLGGLLDGVTQNGVVFQFTPENQLTVLHTFYEGDSSDVQNPVGKLTQDAQGNMYGGALSGKNSAIYKIDSSLNESVLTDCCAGSASMVVDQQGDVYSEGDNSVQKTTPSGEVTTIFTAPAGISISTDVAIDSTGNLYGTTSNGGVNKTGSVFKLTKHGS